MEEKKFTWKEIDEEVEGIVTETVTFLSELKGRVDAVQEKIKHSEEPSSIEEKLIAALDKETIKEMSQMSFALMSQHGNHGKVFIETCKKEINPDLIVAIIDAHIRVWYCHQPDKDFLLQEHHTYG